MSIDKLENRFDREIEQLGVRIKDVNQLKVRQDVFDEVTLLALYKLVHKGWITAMGGSISTGKEANVFFGERGDQDLAIKIYRIRTANFNAMSEYLIGDRAFLKYPENPEGYRLHLDKKKVLQPGKGARSWSFSPSPPGL